MYTIERLNSIWMAAVDVPTSIAKPLMLTNVESPAHCDSCRPPCNLRTGGGALPFQDGAAQHCAARGRGR